MSVCLSVCARWTSVHGLARLVEPASLFLFFVQAPWRAYNHFVVDWYNYSFAFHATCDMILIIRDCQVVCVTIGIILCRKLPLGQVHLSFCFPGRRLLGLRHRERLQGSRSAVTSGRRWWCRNHACNAVVGPWFSLPR